MKIVIIAWAVIILFVIIITADHSGNNDRIYNYLFYGNDCDFDVRGNGYFLAKIKGRYAIGRHAQYGVDEYLTGFSTKGIVSIQMKYKYPATFADSCAAKGYLVAYIKQWVEEQEEKNPKIEILK